jgi:hypothetical protein
MHMASMPSDFKVKGPTAGNDNFQEVPESAGKKWGAAGGGPDARPEFPREDTSPLFVMSNRSSNRRYCI